MIGHPEKIVVLGFLSHFPVPGVVWQTLHYLEGFRRLGFDVYYVEAHGCTQTKLTRSPEDDGAALAAEYIAGVMDRFGFSDRWAYFSPYPEPRCFGMTRGSLSALCRSASALFNLHGSHLPTEDLCATNRLVYVGTDPVEVEIALHDGDRETIDYLSPHCLFFTFGENMGRSDCRLPSPTQFAFLPTRQPVVMDYWENQECVAKAPFTTIGNWRQSWRKVVYQGETYRWSKHLEFEKFIDLPKRTSQPFELALASFEEKDRSRLEGRGWRVRPAADLSKDPWVYRDYIAASRGEFTVAKDQNVRFRTGWFSDRAATYLAAGRPVITQETGFSNLFPTGSGLFGFQTVEDILQAVETINGDYRRSHRAALELAHEFFDSARVLSPMLQALGLRTAPPSVSVSPSGDPFPDDLNIRPISRWPTRLPEATLRFAESLPIPECPTVPDPVHRRASILLVTHNGLPYTKLCLTTLLNSNWNRADEIIVVDNGSSDGTADYLRELAEQCHHVRVVFNRDNIGFAAANNQAAATARGRFLVFLNNDTLPAEGWLDRLIHWLSDSTIGMVGPATNRTCNEAEVEVPYETYGQFKRFAVQYTRRHHGKSQELSMLALFCAAMRREVFLSVGPLDEQFEVGMFEDDDYAHRLHRAGFRTVCVDDVFVHHFGQASLGELCDRGDYNRVYDTNRERFETKWNLKWKPHGHRHSLQYHQLRDRIRGMVEKRLPAGATVAVVSKGDEELVGFKSSKGWHFPQDDNGSYANVYPADSTEAVDHLERLRGKGATHLLLPKTAFWWLEHYAEFRRYLTDRYEVTLHEDETCLVYDLTKTL